MSYFALVYDVVDDFVTLRQPYRAQHLSLALAARERGELVLAGAFAEPVDGALLVFHGSDRSVAESFARSDPYVRAGLVTRWTVRPWSVVIDGRSSEPSSSTGPGQDPLPAFFERSVIGLAGPWLERARQFRPVSAVAIEELGAHPDLGERLRDVTAGLAGTEVGVHYRMFAARKHGGRIFAVAQGTRLLHFRVGRSRAADACRSGANPDVELGPDWVELDAWNPDPAAAAWLTTLRGLASLAHATDD